MYIKILRNPTILLLLFISLLISCNKKDSVSIDRFVKISSIDTILDNQIKIKISSNSTVEYQLGVCYDTLSPPVFESKNAQFALLEATLNSLNPNTKYFIRAYAIDTSNKDTLYSNEISVQTLNTDKVIDINNNHYPTVKFGNQIWMAEDLKVNSFNDGSPAGWDVGSLVYYTSFDANDPRNLCPDGYHLPSVDEWMGLIEHLGGNEIAGEKLKSTSITININREKISDFNGFNAKLNGYRYEDSTTFFSNKSGFYWTSDENTNLTTNGWYFSLYDNLTRIEKISHSKELGLSVRCLKN